MQQGDYWFITLILTGAILGLVFWWLWVPGEGEQHVELKEATQSGMIISEIKPQEGPLSGGAQVLILGQNFDEEVEVLFGNALAEKSQRLEDKAVVVTAPPASEAGSVLVRMVGKFGETIAPSVYTYLE